MFAGAHGFGASEDYPEWVVAANNGFRIWKVIDPDTGTLQSTNQSYNWTPGVNASRCMASPRWLDRDACKEALHPDTWAHTPACPRHPECEYPTKDCSCGFYAYFAPEWWSGGYTQQHPVVCGIVEGFGRCVIGDKGFRASRVLVVAFALPVRFGVNAWGYGGSSVDASPEFQERVRAGLLARFPTVPVFDSPEAMLERIPLTGRPDRVDAA